LGQPIGLLPPAIVIAEAVACGHHGAERAAMSSQTHQLETRFAHILEA
jgi:hypothetical protein